jgi:uncharacterized membrane protein YfcA
VDWGLLLLIALGFGVGAYGTVIGAGGGFILVPALLFLFPGYNPERVTAISLAVVWANATSGSIAYARLRRIDFVTGAIFVLASIPGVLAGTFVVRFVDERLFSALFGALLLVMAGVVLAPRPTTIREPVRRPGQIVRVMVMPDGVSYRYAYIVWQAALLSLGVGFIASLFGVGGGVMHVPLMIVLFRIPVELAVATSQFILAMMSGGASAVHLSSGALAGRQLVEAAFLAAGAIPGAQAGAWLARRLSNRRVLGLLALALVALSVRLIIRGVAGL